MLSDIPIEILITVGAGIILLFIVCIVALLVRRKCQQADLNNQAIYNQSTVSSSGGYATAKPHTRSSWTCTYKAGRQHQGDTHIWETPLPEPSADEYTLPTNMRQTHGNTSIRQDNTSVPAAMLDSMEYTVPISCANAHEGSSHKAEYTKPVKALGQRDMLAENPLLPSDTNNGVEPNRRQSQANYYYYDPSNGEQSEYMAPQEAKGRNQLDMLPPYNMSEIHTDTPGDNVPVSRQNQDTRECAYRTLIRLDDSSN